VFAITLFDYYLDAEGITDNAPWITALLWPKEFLYGPLVYFYTRELTRPAVFPISGTQMLHFLPAVVHLLLSWSLLSLDPGLQVAILEGREDLAGGLWLWSLALGDVEVVLSVLHVGLYLYLCLGVLRAHRRLIHDNFSSTEHINLNWLARLILGLLLVYLIWVADEAISGGVATSEFISIALGLSMVSLIYTMGFLGLRQPSIFSRPLKEYVQAEQADELTGPEASEVADVDDVIERDKYQNSALDQSGSTALWQVLEDLMARDKLYLDPQLSLPQLADKLGVSVNYVSQAINQNRMNFFEYTNRYRVEEAKRLMDRDVESSLLDVGFQAGFNSKSAFYNAFRKYAEQSPGQYRTALKTR
ncbi:MAG: AraC family transcriptional regulator, partial [Pseudomonadota bacterium]|nr:AraC family transcriptional regulator [Pseudomonadota bacterium]